ncbi:MYXO-CTERM sorting domain-containing protein [Nannocystaceae bacterium ST9]
MRLRFVPIALVLAVGGASPLVAQAGELRFSITAKGGVVSTGNTLGLSKQAAANGPGTGDSIGTFLTPDAGLFDTLPANPGNPWPAGTTSDWTLDGSSALLALPESSSGVEVVYAELVWGGSYLYGTENVSAELDVPVTLTVDGASFDAVPDPTTEVTLAEVALGGFAVNYYMRSADVTEFVAEQLAGTYTVTGVPATQDFSIEQLNAAGWTLVVVYRSAEAPTRNLTVFVGGQFVDEDATEDYPVEGFCTPPQGTVEGAVVISAIEGDANRAGDSFRIAPNANGPFAALSGPNNPIDNFFASQINDPEGNLDTLGSAGDANHDAFAGVNVVGGRQGWDVTKVPVSSMNGQLGAGQTSAVLRAVTTGDSFMPVLAAFEIDVSSPDFEGNTAIGVAPQAIAIGEQATITLAITNAGEVIATDLSFQAPLGQGLELVSFALDGVAGDVDQQPVTSADLIAGVAIGDVDAGASRELTLVVEASGEPPTPEGWLVTANWTYDYVSCVGEEPLTEQSYAFVDLGFVAGGDTSEGDTGEGGSDSPGTDTDTGATAGESGGESGTDEGAEANDEIGTEADAGASREGDGCDCRSTGTGTSSPFALALLAAGGWLLRRRRSPRASA